MLSVPVANEWVETARLFGDIESVVTAALRNYSIEQCQQRINKATALVASYNQKYHCDYEVFQRDIQTDSRNSDYNGFGGEVMPQSGDVI